MLILGIDPGYATVGYGLVQHERGKFTHIRHGAITTQPHVPMHLRLKEIHEDMLTLLDTFHPDAVSVEELFFNTNITTGIQVAHARGVILLACAERGITPAEYTPSQVKQSVVGYGRAAGHGNDQNHAASPAHAAAGRCRRCLGASDLPCAYRGLAACAAALAEI